MKYIYTGEKEAQVKCDANNVASIDVFPRLHMITFDLSLISGIMRHGSIGFSLKNMPIHIAVTESREDSIEYIGLGRDNIDLDSKIDFTKIREFLHNNKHYHVTIKLRQCLKSHLGLGLSTQILGGVYLCCAKLSKRTLFKSDLFKLGLGHYSALGLNLLFNPGMIVEMGTKSTQEKDGLIIDEKISVIPEKPSETNINIDNFPYWIIVAIPKEEESISAIKEEVFWDEVLPDKKEYSYRIVYNVFEEILPGINEKDYDRFIAAFKESITLGSKSFEESIQSQKTKTLLQKLRKIFDFAAVSSLGPTLFAFSKDNPSQKVKELKENSYHFFVYGPDGSIRQKINDDESALIASFACIGKTTYAKEHPQSAIDIESIHYERCYKKHYPNDEIAKGKKNWSINPEYPKNYINAVRDYYGKKKIIFLTGGKELVNGLGAYGFECQILYPGEYRKKQVLTDARKRKNSPGFVRLLNRLLKNDAHLTSFADLDNAEIVIINDDKYMDDFIEEHYIL